METTQRSTSSPAPGLQRRPVRRSDPYLCDLNEEWDRLNAGCELRPRVEATLDVLRRAGPAPLRTVNNLDDVLAVVSRHPDTALLFLLECCQSGDYIAARVVIQAMLPKLVRITDSVRRGRGFDQVLAEAVAAMRELVFAYPIGRRPHSVAGNLALDTLKAVRLLLGSDVPQDVVERLADAPASGVALALAQFSDPGTPRGSVSDELASVLRCAQDSQLITSADVALLWRVACSGETSASIATTLGLTPEALRKRCSRLKFRLRANASELAA